jgi:hypothetical protein
MPATGSGAFSVCHRQGRGGWASCRLLAREQRTRDGYRGEDTRGGASFTCLPEQNTANSLFCRPHRRRPAAKTRQRRQGAGACCSERAHLLNVVSSFDKCVHFVCPIFPHFPRRSCEIKVTRVLHRRSAAAAGSRSMVPASGRAALRRRRVSSLPPLARCSRGCRCCRGEPDAALARKHQNQRACHVWREVRFRARLTCASSMK